MKRIAAKVMKQEILPYKLIYYKTIYRNKISIEYIIEMYYRMNDLDLLQNDITKIINRKVQDLHIIERRKERKENRKINREQKQKASLKIDE